MRGSVFTGGLFGLALLLTAGGCRFVLPISEVEETGPACGDGVVDPEETCDPGEVGDPGCDETCHVLEGWSCAGEPSVCAPICGDGLVVAEGECEGQVPEGVTCESTGHGAGDIACGAECRLDYSGCILVMGVGAGADHSCARLSSGRVACWGGNDRGQLGDGTTSERLTAVFTQELGQVTALALGDAVSCAVYGPPGGVACWGDNRLGQLGLGSESPGQVNVPQPLPWFDEAHVPAFLSGHARHFCAVLFPGTGIPAAPVVCWGANAAGQVDAGVPGPDVDEPRIVEDFDGVLQACAGLDHSCALLDVVTGDNLVCWGANDRGQLGDGTTEPRDVPVTVPGRYQSVSCGSSFTCAVTETSGVACWGSGEDGRLGSGGTDDSSTPVGLVLPEMAVQVSLGQAHACARLVDGSLACWGRNWDGQLGDGTYIEKDSPVPLSGLTGVHHVSAGHTHTCAATGGSAWCWGANDHGQLGDGTHRPGSPTPQIVLFE